MTQDPTSAELHPPDAGDPDPLKVSAQWLVDGYLPQAETTLRDAIAASPQDWRLECALGDLLVQAGREEEAMGIYMRALDHNPQLGDACAKIGRALLARGLAEPALVWLERAAQVDHDDQACMPAHATALIRLGRFAEAKQTLQSWIASAPHSAIRRHLAAALLGEPITVNQQTAYTIELFDQYADQFDESLGRLGYCGPRLVFDALLGMAAPNVPTPIADWDVLDVGCGTGLVGELVRPLARHLVGVDLSAGMLRKARERNRYDELVQEEAIGLMVARPRCFDAVLAADVLTYLGKLEGFFQAARTTLRPGGWLVVVCEHCHGETHPEGYRLHPTGRFAHQEHYVQQCLTTAGLRLRSRSYQPMRTERGRPTPTLTVVAQAEAANA